MSAPLEPTDAGWPALILALDEEAAADIAAGNARVARQLIKEAINRMAVILNDKAGPYHPARYAVEAIDALHAAGTLAPEPHKFPLLRHAQRLRDVVAASSGGLMNEATLDEVTDAADAIVDAIETIIEAAETSAVFGVLIAIADIASNTGKHDEDHDP